MPRLLAVTTSCQFLVSCTSFRPESLGRGFQGKRRRKALKLLLKTSLGGPCPKKTGGVFDPFDEVQDKKDLLENPGREKNDSGTKP